MLSARPQTYCFLGEPCRTCDFCTSAGIQAAKESASRVFRPSGERRIFKAEFASYIAPAANFDLFGVKDGPADLDRLFTKAKLADRPILVGCRLKYGVMPDGGHYMMQWHAIFERPRPCPLREMRARLEEASRRNSARIIGLNVSVASAHQVGEAIDDVFAFTWASVVSLSRAQLPADQKELLKHLKVIPSADRLWGKNMFRDHSGCWYRFDGNTRSSVAPATDVATALTSTSS